MEVERRTPPPKQSKQEMMRGCLSLAASEMHAGSIPLMKLPSPKASIDNTLAVDTSIVKSILH